MRKLVLVATALVALVASSAASATDTSIVGPGCILANGGHVTRPAGTDIVVRVGWVAKTPGLVQDFLGAQTTTVAVNDGPAVDLSGGYGAPEPSGADWASFTYDDTGVVLAPGESLTFDLTLDVSHRVTDGLLFANGSFGAPLFGGPGALVDGTCTVTGV
jgi:hypothetical protein